MTDNDCLESFNDLFLFSGIFSTFIIGKSISMRHGLRVNIVLKSWVESIFKTTLILFCCKEQILYRNRKYKRESLCAESISATPFLQL